MRHCSPGFRYPALFVFLLGTLLLGALVSCSGGGDSVTRALAPTPSAFGKMNSVTIVTDTAMMKEAVGDSIVQYFGAPYILLPRPEAIFDLRVASPYQLKAEPTLRETRSYLVVANLSDTDSETTQMVLSDLRDSTIQKIKRTGFGTFVATDKWATGQILIYLVGTSYDNLAAGIAQVAPQVVSRLKGNQRERLESIIYVEGTDRAIMDTIRQRVGADIRIPADYLLSPVPDTGVVWLRRDLPDGTVNIMLTRRPYQSQDQLSQSGIQSIRDTLGRRYVSTQIEGTYMVVNDTDLPLFTTTMQLNGNYAVETRGIWEIRGDFLAGPFVSYLIYNEAKPDLLFVDGFIHAPGRNKRDLMEELTFILNTTRY